MPYAAASHVISGTVVPLTGLIDPNILIEGGRKTIVYDQDEAVRQWACSSSS